MNNGKASDRSNTTYYTDLLLDLGMQVPDGSSANKGD